MEKALSIGTIDFRLPAHHSDMGLLTNPKTRARFISLIRRFCNPLCILCYIIGIVWFLALAYHPLNAGTYFSENALLPGRVFIYYNIFCNLPYVKLCMNVLLYECSSVLKQLVGLVVTDFDHEYGAADYLTGIKNIVSVLPKASDES